MDNMVRTYGYLLNLDYTPNEGDIFWNFERYESEGIVTQYKGIEGVNLESCEDYVIIGCSRKFINWLGLNDVDRQEDYSLFDGSLLVIQIPQELERITEQQYGSYYLPKTLDMNGNIIVPIWIAYDDNFTDIWVTLRSLQQIKYKPIR